MLVKIYNEITNAVTKIKVQTERNFTALGNLIITANIGIHIHILNIQQIVYTLLFYNEYQSIEGGMDDHTDHTPPNSHHHHHPIRRCNDYKPIVYSHQRWQKLEY